jgi:DNA repair exonuclease SbcCD ATPase subunit
MKTDQNTTSNQSVQSLKSHLNDLLDEAKKVNYEIDEINKETREKMNDLDAKVNESINNLEQLYADLDKHNLYCIRI